MLKKILNNSASKWLTKVVFSSVLQTDRNVQSDPALHEHHADRPLQPRVSHENILFRREGKLSSGGMKRLYNVVFVP
jgi:hypothetical protein